MKKIKYTMISAALVALSLGFAGCDSEKFLDVNHYDILPADAMFADESSAQTGLNGIYDMLFPDDNYASAWNYKPQLFLGCHPTLDTQCTGYDTDFSKQNYKADKSELKEGWIYSYRAIGRCNDFLEGMEDENVKSFGSYNQMVGQAKALRAYFYMFLAQNWGKIPMLATGENYVNTPNKANAETDDEVWDFIIDDLKDAAEKLDWAPANGEYGRCTKGMALSYLGEAYLWKAYKARLNGDGDAKSRENIQLAKDALQKVIDSGTYELVPSYSTLYDADEAWPKEAVWQVVMDMGTGNYSQWNTDAHIFNNFFAASTNGGGGWGSEYLSWELYFLFEKGDKRRDASMCTSPVQELPEEYRSKYAYGENPFMQQKLGLNSDGSLNDNNGYMYSGGGEYAPSIWSMKYWRLQRAQWSTPHSPCHYYYKRYSGVLLDYAECLFRLNGGNDATAWGIIDQIRNRAFGNLEVGKAEALNSKFTAYYKTLANCNDDYSDYVAKEDYPIPFSTETVTVPDAKTYYAQFASETVSNGILEHETFSGKAEVWEVALLQERRKEFNSEWNLKADLQRSDILETHIACDYPKGKGLPNADKGKKDNWHYYRDWDFNAEKLLMPIPQDEILKNSLIKQNPGY